MSEAQNGGNVMERLTTRDANCADPKVLYGVYVKNHDYISAANRLADYEDTELTPEEIDMDHEAAEQLRHLCRDCDLDRLEKLAEADKAGRLVVLPCKVGDTVYFRTYDCNGTVDLGIQPHKVTAIVGHAIVRGRYTDVGLLPGQYGVSWFLTREAAEKALEAMKDK